jgi:hypothetical protein
VLTDSFRQDNCALSTTLFSNEIYHQMVRTPLENFQQAKGTR